CQAGRNDELITICDQFQKASGRCLPSFRLHRTRRDRANQNLSCITRVVPLWLRRMASITLKSIPMELHAQLKNEAAANFRSITQEAMSRLERTFQIDAALTTKRDQQWIDEAIASGPATALTKKEM